MKVVRTRTKAKGKRARHPDKLQSTSRLDGNLRLTYKQQLMSKNVKKLKSDEPGKNIQEASQTRSSGSESAGLASLFVYYFTGRFFSTTR